MPNAEVGDFNAPSVEGSCNEGNFNHAMQRAIEKLPSDVFFKIGNCRWKNGTLTVALEYHRVYYGAPGAAK